MIIQWLEAALGDVIEASDGKEARVNCPFCYGRIGRADEKHHMYVSQIEPVAFCFRCGWQGNYISLIMSVSGCNYAQALKELEEPTPNVQRFDRIFSPMGLVMGHSMASKPDGFQLVSDGIESREGQAVWKYLTRVRHVSPHIARKYMGYVPGSRRAWILVDTNYWQGRLMMPGEPKYLSAPWPKGDALWNAGALAGRSITVCEGVFSALAVGSKAIALCGKTITQPQARRIARSGVQHIRIMLDADATAHSYDVARALLRSGFSGQIIIHELSNGDPTDGMSGIEKPYDGWCSEVREGLSSHEFMRLHIGVWAGRSA